MADKISITICGDGGCGKSSITMRLVRSQWIHEYDPTIEDSYSVTRTIDGRDYFLSITDTAGQEEYRGIWASSNLKSDAFLLVYDITSLQSLETLDYFMDMIDIETDQRLEDSQRLLNELGGSNSGTATATQGLGVGMPPPVKIVAGNKCDLKDSRAVSAREGLEYARKHGCGFMETSAREMVNIEETFALIVRRVIEARRQHYLSQQPVPRMGSSTARTPALTAGEKSTNGDNNNDNSQSANRWQGRFLGGFKKATTNNNNKRVSFVETSEKGQDKGEKTKPPKDEGIHFHTWWRRLLCR